MPETTSMLALLMAFDKWDFLPLRVFNGKEGRGSSSRTMEEV